MTILTLAKAEILADAALAEGHRLGLAPLTIVVLDAGGHVVTAKREDGSGILRFEIAYGKAWGALGMGFGTRELTQRAATSPAFIAAISAARGGRIVPSPGGVLVRVHRPGAGQLAPDTANRPSEGHTALQVDDDIHNDGDLQHLQAEVYRVVQRLRAAAGQPEPQP
jgi:uncharacterized protein GlcG (DUF336 family)